MVLQGCIAPRLRPQLLIIGDFSDAKQQFDRDDGGEVVLEGLVQDPVAPPRDLLDLLQGRHVHVQVQAGSAGRGVHHEVFRWRQNFDGSHSHLKILVKPTHQEPRQHVLVDRLEGINHGFDEYLIGCVV